MRKSKSLLATFLLLFVSTLTYAQYVTINGNVKSSITKESVGAVSVLIKGTNEGTFTDDKGNFKFNTSRPFPITLVISSVGFEPKEVVVNNANDIINVDFVPSAALGQEVVVAATRVSSRIMESPVSVERVGASALKNAPAASYYDVVGNLKGVDLITSSLTFKTVTTRGFAGSGNTRFNQIMDGMDNQAPGLNFSVGAMLGLTELDVESMELLPGASSALYGPGGMNGTLLINSKNPFKYQGFSAQVKLGMMHTDGKYRDPSAYHNWSMRWAHKIGDKFAFKINAELIQAKDWLAADRRNYNRTTVPGYVKPGTRETDPDYDGVNVYGDETRGDINGVFAAIGSGVPPLKPFMDSLMKTPHFVSRTGYNEKEVTDPNTINFKLGGAAHYKITPKLEAVLAGYWGTGTTVYTGSDRYSLRELKMGQYKLELNSSNWFLRAYTTQEDAGESYNTTITTRLFNEAWKPSSSKWFPEYGQAFATALLSGMSEYDAHTAARAVADAGRPVPGTEAFRNIYDQIRTKPIKEGGGLFVDRTNLYAAEGQYNFTHLTGDFAEILVGANFRRFVLNSEGTLFADSAGTIPIDEYGAYLQITKPLFNDVVKLTLSGRYDKNENFAGRFTPRATATVKVATDNFLRFSFQSAYRFPSTQQQYIDLLVGGGVRLIGGVDFMKDKYEIQKYPVYLLGNTTTPYVFDDFKPESVISYEVGYRGLLMQKRLLIDAYGYFGNYENFIVRTVVNQPQTGRILSIPENTGSKVKTYGYALGLEYRFTRGFFTNVNFGSDVLNNVPTGFIAGFNSPKYRANVIVGNTGFGRNKRIGFNVSYRWQDEYLYESDFMQGTNPAFHTLDAQISYKVLNNKSVIRLGANNLLNQYYTTAPGNPSIGGLYYVAFGFNVF